MLVHTYGLYLCKETLPKTVLTLFFSDGIAYVSLGLSRDMLMGDDSVMECIRENGTIRLYSSWNERRTNYRNDVVSK